ncbi:MAG TPA: hypothetical protein VN763_06705, partial [Saprospiraceae bacterium]|nr:hypothetical protein [Saprospiraceae bacterium]
MALDIVGGFLFTSTVTNVFDGIHKNASKPDHQHGMVNNERCFTHLYPQYNRRKKIQSQQPF